ncbi:hypothetical protein AB0165_29655, partial [Klebsiella variicola]
MLEAIAQQHPDLPVQYLHGTLDGSTHALANDVHALATGHPNIRVTNFYQTPRAEDVAGRDYDHDGLIDEPWLTAHTPIEEADYYL